MRSYVHALQSPETSSRLTEWIVLSNGPQWCLHDILILYTCRQLEKQQRIIMKNHSAVVDTNECWLGAAAMENVSMVEMVHHNIHPYMNNPQ